MKKLPCDRCGIILERKRFSRNILCRECKPIMAAIARSRYSAKRRAKNKKPDKLLACGGCGQYVFVRNKTNRIDCETCRPIKAAERTMASNAKKDWSGGGLDREKHKRKDPLDPYFPALQMPKKSDYPGIAAVGSV